MSAEAEIKQLIDRILRLKEEQDALGEDIREVYAEAKGRGYDKTALGHVVSHVRKVQKLGQDTLHEREAIFDLYLTAYETGGQAPASARTRENIDEFPSKELSSQVAANTGGDDVDGSAARASTQNEVDVAGPVNEASTSTFNPPAFLQDQTKSIRDYRPHCQKPDACGASGLKHCYSCAKLIAPESEVA
ncbi:DUF2312 domain-containing protein [Phyllobacterium lublinensis]|uniref:DUF2312 domain-containing protein n=1 Tax=Phyllobacterium lublinensis TaxID=2875708 RepID=UPI001CD021A9|nr:DUF2312 domain-containing protein [Phyllobacterium sp. 2063]MBZ9653517.1 DUF2312 domain-containing protein [Phyllobacterium sp. 2063]